MKNYLCVKTVKTQYIQIWTDLMQSSRRDLSAAKTSLWDLSESTMPEAIRDLSRGKYKLYA